MTGGVCPLKKSCWESAQERDFLPDDLKSISGAEEPEKMYSGSLWKRLEVDGPSFSGGLKDLPPFPRFERREGKSLYLLAWISEVLFCVWADTGVWNFHQSGVNCCRPKLAAGQAQSPAVIQEPNIVSELWAPVMFKCLWNLHSEGCSSKWYLNKSKLLQFSK